MNFQCNKITRNFTLDMPEEDLEEGEVCSQIPLNKNKY